MTTVFYNWCWRAVMVFWGENSRRGRTGTGVRSSEFCRLLLHVRHGECQAWEWTINNPLNQRRRGLHPHTVWSPGFSSTTFLYAKENVVVSGPSYWFLGFVPAIHSWMSGFFNMMWQGSSCCELGNVLGASLSPQGCGKWVVKRTRGSWEQEPQTSSLLSRLSPGRISRASCGKCAG